MNHPRCKSCSKWTPPSLHGEVDLHNPPRGECHLNPPIVHACFMPKGPSEVLVKPFNFWPQTSYNDWCAQHSDWDLKVGNLEDKEHRETYGRNSSVPLSGDQQ